jgi:hypothetical protein
MDYQTGSGGLGAGGVLEGCPIGVVADGGSAED